MSRKGNIIQVTVNDQERATMKAAAEKAGMPLATFLRFAVLRYLAQQEAKA